MDVDVKAVLRQYFSDHRHLSPAEASELSDQTPLLSYGILDSLAVLQLVTYLEQHFEFEFTPQELDRRRLETLEQIEALVRAKLVARG